MILLLFKSICIKYTVIIAYLNDLDSWLPFLFTLYTGERLLEVETMVTMRQRKQWHRHCLGNIVLLFKHVLGVLFVCMHL